MPSARSSSNGGKVSRGQPGDDSDARAQAPCGDRAVVDAAAGDGFLGAVHDDTVDGEVAEHEEVEGIRVHSGST